MNIELEFIKIYNMEYDIFIHDGWIFYVNAKIVNSSKVIPYDTVFTLDIKYGDTSDIGICSYVGLDNGDGIINLECKAKQTVPASALITLNNVKTENSSITWRGTIPNNLDIYINGYVDIESVDNCVYNSNKQQWSFDMNLFSYSYTNIPLNSKTKIDIKYNEQETTATCTCTATYKLVCIPDVEGQSNNDYFEIVGEEKGTLSYYYPDINLKIIYKANLKFELAYNLLLVGYKIKFNIKISESDLPNNRAVKVDFKDEYSDYTALCTKENNYTFNTLSCESVYNYYYTYTSVYLYNNNNNKNIIWSNLNKDEPIYLLLHIKVKETCGYFRENSWKFNINYELTEGEFKTYYYYKHVLLDILVNNEESTALCQISSDYLLNCESKHNNQNLNDKIIISNLDSPIKGTVYITNELAESQIEIKPAELNVNLVKIASPTYSNNKLSFSIIGYLSNDFYSTTSTLTEIVISINKTNGEEATSRACCEIFYDYYYFDFEYYYNQNNFIKLQCITDEEISQNDVAKLKINSEGYSKFIQFALTKENQELTINPKNNENKDDDYYDDYYDDNHNYYHDDNHNNYYEDDDYNNGYIDGYNNDNKYDENNAKQTDDINNDKNITKGNIKDENSKTKKAIAGIVGGGVGVALISAFIVGWRMLSKNANALVPTKKLGNDDINFNGNKNTEVYSKAKNLKNSENKNIKINESLASKQNLNSAKPIHIKKHKSKHQ